MSFTLLSIELDCKKHNGQDPVYRIWLDDCLIIERVYWPNNESHYIQEQLSFEDDNNQHCLRVEKISESGSLEIKSIKTQDGDTLDTLDDTVCSVNIINNTVTFKTPKR